MIQCFKILLLLFIPTCLFAQNKQILFGFDDIPQTLMLNPGAPVNNAGYVGLPLLSQVHLRTGFSGLSAYDLFADNGTDFNTKLRQAVYNMDASDHFAINEQLDILSGGFAFGKTYEKTEYLSFGLYQETDVFLYFPKDYAVLVLEGNQQNINKVFDLSDLNMSGEVLSVFHVGYNKKLNSKLNVGVRGKIYSSIINVNSTHNAGTFITVPGENNYLNHIFNLGLQVNTSGAASLLNDDNSDVSKDIKELKSRMLFGGNLGLGLDLGLTYQPTDQWTIQASIQDIGFISHKKDVESYSLNGYLEYEGINPVFDANQPGQSAEEYWNDVANQFEELFTVDTTYTKYTTWRPVKINTSLSYAFGRKVNKTCNCLQEKSGYLNQVGAHLFFVNRPKVPQIAFTAFYYRRLLDQLRIKATYTIDSYSFSNLGLGLSAHLGGVNFYILADNLLSYQNLAKAKSVSLQLGFNYIFNKK